MMVMIMMAMMVMIMVILNIILTFVDILRTKTNGFMHDQLSAIPVMSINGDTQPCLDFYQLSHMICTKGIMSIFDSFDMVL